MKNLPLLKLLFVLVLVFVVIAATANAQKAVTAALRLAIKTHQHGLRAKDKTFNAELITNFDETLPKVDAIKDKIMQPFFTTKLTGEGTGLGLSLRYDIVVKEHGGKIDINAEIPGFTEFIITLSIA